MIILLKKVITKEEVQKIIEMEKSVRGQPGWTTYHMEHSIKLPGESNWRYISWSVPYSIVDFKVTKYMDNIYMSYVDGEGVSYRYRLRMSINNILNVYTNDSIEYKAKEVAV